MSKAEVVASILLLGATLYAVFGGADFGAGFWELFARRAKDPEAVRHRIERSVAPVWEANHVWLIFILVYFWTGFPEGFAAVMSTLYIPLALAAVGIVLRGSGFAFGKAIEPPWRERAQTGFALSSILTPFFMGCVIGAIAAGDVPADGNGDPMGWVGVLPFSIGALFVAGGAYISAVFLAHDASASGETENARVFGRWALGAAAAAGVLAAVGAWALGDAGHVWDGLTGDALPIALASIACGGVALVLIARSVRSGEPMRWVRPFAVGAFALLIVAWGVAQHPYLLPESLTISAAAAPDVTLNVLLIVFGLAGVIVIPALGFLYTLSQKSLQR